MQTLLSSQEVQQYLRVDQAGIDELVRKKKLTAFKIGGTYLRFPKDQVIALQTVLRKKSSIQRPTLWSRTRDFVRYNGFYIFSAGVLIAAMYYFLQ